MLVGLSIEAKFVMLKIPPLSVRPEPPVAEKDPPVSTLVIPKNSLTTPLSVESRSTTENSKSCGPKATPLLSSNWKVSSKAAPCELIEPKPLMIPLLAVLAAK